MKSDDSMDPNDDLYLNQNYKYFYQVIEKDLDDDETLPTIISQLDKVLTQASRDFVEENESLRKLSKAHFEYFIQEGLRDVVRTLLSRKFLETQRRDYQNAELVNEFLIKVIQFIVPFIEKDGPLDLIDSLRRLMDENRPLYVQTMYYKPENEEKDPTFERFAVYKAPSHSSFSMRWEFVSPFLIININIFGHSGGFDAIIARFKNTSPKLDITRVKIYLRILSMICPFLLDNVRENILKEIYDSVVSLFLNFTDNELRPLEKIDFEEVSSNLQNLISLTTIFEGRVHELIEKFCLDFALKCFKCQLLEKRLIGLAYIEEVVERAENKDRLHQMDDYPLSYQGIHRSFASRWIDIKYITKWLIDNAIIEEIFANSFHPTLIKKSTRLVQFMARKGALTDFHLDIIWNSTIDKHETIRNSTYDLLSTSHYFFQDKHLEYLLEKIETLSQALTNRAILLSIEFSKCTHYPIREKALNLLWNIIQDSNTSVKLDIKVFTLKQFAKFVSDVWMYEKRKELLDTCINSIQSKYSVAQSIQILRSIIDTYQTSHHFESSSKKSIINRLEQEQLVECLLEELISYRETNKEKAKTLGAFVDETIFQGIFPHLEQMKIRLDFFYYLFSSKLTLTIKYIETLWNQFIFENFSLAERDIGFEFFEKLPSIDFISAELLKNILTTLLGSLDPSEFTRSSFRCFEKYFVAINQKVGKMNSDRQVKDSQLEELNSLWNIVLNVHNPVVFNEASDWLIHLYTQPSSSQQESEKNTRFFLSSVISYLKGTLKEEQNHTQKIDRCLDLIKLFLKRSKQSIEVTQHERGKLLTLNISNTISEPSQLTIKIYQEDSFYILKHKLAKILNLEISDLVLYLGAQEGLELNNDKQLKDFPQITTTPILLKKFQKQEEIHQAYQIESRYSEYELQRSQTIVEIFGLPQTAAIAALRRTNGNLDDAIDRLSSWETFLAEVMEEGSRMPPISVPNTKNSEPEKTVVASLILSENEEFFDLIFELLLMNSINTGNAWDILMKLPTNQNLLNNLKNISQSKTVEWNKLLDPRPNAVYRLLYSLQIIDFLMQGADETEEEQIQWNKSFLYYHGFDYVFKLFTSFGMNDNYENHPAWKTCLPILLRIVNYFIKGDLSVLPENFLHSNQEHEGLRHSGETLNQIIDYPSFLQMMLKLLWKVCKLSDPESVSQALSLINIIIAYRIDLLNYFYNFPDLENLLKFLLLENKNPQIRADSVAEFYKICCINIKQNSLIHPHTFFLNYLLMHLPEQDSPTSEQYFNFLNLLIKDSCKGKESGSSSKFSELLKSLIVKIKTKPPTETHRADTEDRVLIGYLNIVQTLVSAETSWKKSIGSKEDQGMIKELYSYLFNVTTNSDLEHPSGISSCKFKTMATRSAGFSLLAELVKDCPENFIELIQLLKPHHVIEGTKDVLNWENPKIFDKSSSGYVGLKNLGSICYVNSLMQQFYMLPALRNNLLSISMNPLNEENLLFQIQKMFSYLHKSERQYFNPHHFCRNFKDWEGNPINTALQQDVLEFYNVLCDHLEALLKGTEQEKLLENTFMGTLSQEFIGKECTHYSESTEPFYTISVDIKDKRGLKEALDSFVGGELLEGESAYLCSECKKKVRALKRTSIKRISPALIIHLKRFEYVVERQAHRKLSDYFEFPIELNIQPYTKEGIAFVEKGVSDDLKEPSYYQYELVGVLVHSGHADSGHYYSFIKERHPNDQRKGQWFRFDDTNVSPFDIKNLADECFGGVQNSSPSSHYYSQNNYWGHNDNLKLKNAYMLFYERVKPTSNENYVTQVPELLQQKIIEENAQLIRDQQLFDSEYFNFMMEVMQNAQLEPIESLNANSNNDNCLDCIKLATYFVFESYVRIKQKAGYMKWIEILKKFYSNHVPACKWFLDLLTSERRSWFRYLMLECYEDYIRIHFGELLLLILKTLGPHEYSFYLDKEIVTAKDSQLTEVKYKSSCAKFMDYFLACLEFTRQHWRKFLQYFELLRNYILLGIWERAFLASKELVGQLVEYYMGPYSPSLKPGTTRVRIGETNCPADLNMFMMALALMIRSQATDGYLRTKKLPPSILDSTIEPPPLKESEKKLLSNRDFFTYFVKQGYHVESLNTIVVHLVWEDLNFSRWVLEILMELICKANWNACDNFFDTLKCVLQVQDSLERYRAAASFNLDHGGLIEIIHHYHDKFPKFATTCVVFTRECMNLFPEVGRFLYAHRKEWWNQLNSFLQDRILRTRDYDITGLLKDFTLFVENKLELKYDYTQWKEDFDEQLTKLNFMKY